mgnify:CR=1 FL=1
MTAMKNVLRAVSLVALLGTIVPPVMYLVGAMELTAVKWSMAAAAVAWFAATPFWMDRAA